MKPHWISGPVNVDVRIEQWPLSEPFRISGYLWETLEVLIVTLEAGGCRGRGEAAGVYYRGDRPQLMRTAVEHVVTQIRKGLSRATLQEIAAGRCS